METGTGLLGSIQRKRTVAEWPDNTPQTSFNGVVEVAAVPEAVEHRGEKVGQVPLGEHARRHFLRRLAVFVHHLPLLSLPALLHAQDTPAHGYSAAPSSPSAACAERKNLDADLDQNVDSEESVNGCMKVLENFKEEVKQGMELQVKFICWSIFKQKNFNTCTVDRMGVSKE